MRHPFYSIKHGEKSLRNLTFYVRYLKGESISSIFRGSGITYPRCRQIIYKLCRKHQRLKESKCMQSLFSIYIFDCLLALNCIIEREKFPKPTGTE